MKLKTNLLNSGERVFRIFSELLKSDCHKTKLLDNFSEDSLFVYINTLRKLGLDITVPTRKNTCYSIKECLNLINFNEEDIKIFSKMKEILSQKSSYNDVLAFNNILLKFSKYTNKYFTEKLCKVIEQKPFGLEMHEKILGLQNCIDSKKTILISYNSPNSKKNYFKIMPKYLKLENQKMYLWCYDNAFYEARYFRLDRLLDFKILDEPYENINQEKYAVCKFINTGKDLFEQNSNCEIILKNNDFLLVKFYFENNFEFMQKIFSYSHDCEVLEPADLRETFRQKIDLIRKIYG